MSLGRIGRTASDQNGPAARPLGPRIALDVMGGDLAPSATISGAVNALSARDLTLILVGPEAAVQEEIRHQRAQAAISQAAVRIVDAPETIGMAESPVAAVRAKRHSATVVGLDLVARGEADAFVTAGNTGAAMAAAVLGLKRIPGIERPALAVPFPTRHGKPCLLLDVGANPEARPQNLAQFALMGAVYAERVLGCTRPRVGLLSIGEEESKGSSVIQEAHQQFRVLPIDFIGNLEGKDIPAGAADVVVMEGFVGNVLIKFAEGLGVTLLDILQREIRSSLWSTLAGAALLPVFRRVRRRLDYAEYGGAPLLGVQGVCIIAHGRSNPRAVESAIRVAGDAVRARMVDEIRAGVAELNSVTARSGSSSDTGPQ